MTAGAAGAARPNAVPVVGVGKAFDSHDVLCRAADACAGALPATTAARPQGRLARLSVQGLQHALALGVDTVEATAARLYAWNRLPASAWRRSAAEPALVSNKSVNAAGTAWVLVAPGPPASPWCVWRLRNGPVEQAGPGWKLYVSPHPRHLAEAAAAALAAAASLPVVALKYGGDAYGILRPDKLVIHLATRDAVHELASCLLRLLDGCPVHGVPYSAELGGDGLVSWGCDPPAGSAEARVGPSWRAWVTRTLAEGLAGRCNDANEPWRAALDQIARAGVDPLTWAPMPHLWAQTEAA